MHFQIYIPRITGANPRHLDKVGLGDLLRDGDVGPQMSDVLDHGPDGGPGLLFTWPGSLPAYQPEGQTWFAAKPDPERSLAAGRFHWGYPTDAPPTAAGLLRTTLLKGRLIDLADQAWVMPNILLLPHHFILDDQGEEAREVTPDHRWIYDRGLCAFAHLRSQILGEGSAPPQDMRRYVLEMLGLNYRIFRDLAYHLHLLTDVNWFTLACASIDVEALIQIEQDLAKKKAAPTPPT